MMTLTMKRRIITILLGFCFIGIAARADQDVIIQPEKNDLKESYLHEMAAQFFSEKCGIDMALMKNAHMLIRLWQPDRISKDEKENWPQWQIIVQTFPGQNQQHEGGHVMNLTRNGELISWSAHGEEYYEKNPDIVQMGSLAEPLKTDASADDIISHAKEDLIELYHKNPSEYSFNAFFLYEDHFNWGKIPVWVVYVYEDNELRWKGVYSYNGSYMDLVPANQDFYCYQTPGENFFEAYYPDSWYEETLKAFCIMEGRSSQRETQDTIRRWTADYTQWKKTHPYTDEGSLIEMVMRSFPK